METLGNFGEFWGILGNIVEESVRYTGASRQKILAGFYSWDMGGFSGDFLD